MTSSDSIDRLELETMGGYTNVTMYWPVTTILSWTISGFTCSRESTVALSF